MNAPLDVDRCRRGMANLYVTGAPDHPVRRAALDYAIEALNTVREKAFANAYVGVKRYAGFDEQREDHSYGMGPRHGIIVFEIGRRDRTNPVANVDDAIYFLEAVRDFGTFNWQDSPHGAPRKCNLADVLRLHRQYSAYVGELQRALASAEVDSHQQAPA